MEFFVTELGGKRLELGIPVGRIDELVKRHLKVARQTDETIKRNAVRTFFIFLDLLEGYVEKLSNLALALAGGTARGADVAPEIPVEGAFGQAFFVSSGQQRESLVSYRNDLKAAAAAGQSEKTNAAEGYIQKNNPYLDRMFWSHEVLDALRHLEYVCGQPVKGATTQFRRCLHWEEESTRNDLAAALSYRNQQLDQPEQRTQRRMTILPYDMTFSRWQRAKARLMDLIHAFRDWCRDDNVRLPDWWKPNRGESGRRLDG